jgi:hypothetical protein
MKETKKRHVSNKKREAGCFIKKRDVSQKNKKQKASFKKEKMGKRGNRRTVPPLCKNGCAVLQ